MTVSKPLVTIITVCFNSASTIAQTIESILYQTYPNIEYIIIDGASSDGTIEIIKSYEQKFFEKKIPFSWQSQPDNGVYHAMNKGLEKARGVWVNFMNAGDWFYDNNVLSNFFAKTTDSDILYGQTYDAYTKKLVRPIKPISHSYILRYLVICHQSIFAKRDCLPNGFDLNYKITADFAWLLQCFFAKKKFEALNIPVVFYDDGGISSNFKVARKEGYKVVKKHYGILIATVRRILGNINDIRKKITSG